MTAPIAWITGASGGIGLATARELGRRGYRLRVVGRNPDKLDAATAVLEAEGCEVRSFRADFASLDQVRELADTALRHDEPIHLLINNAGVWHPDYRESADGFESTFAVNHLAPFLLTQLLLPRMRETDGDRRIVHVSSRLHRQAGQTASATGRAVHVLNIVGIPAGGHRARFEFDALDRRDGYRGLEAYARSKLAQVIYSAELARREREVTSNAVHPGSVATDVTRDNRVLSALAPLAKVVLKSPARGARTSVHVATDPELRGISGRYFANAREARAADVAGDVEVAARLWKLSSERVGLPSGG